MDTIHLVAIVCIIGILACVGGLIYDHFKNKRRRKPLKNLFANGKTPRSRKKKR